MTETRSERNRRHVQRWVGEGLLLLGLLIVVVRMVVGVLSEDFSPWTLVGFGLFTAGMYVRVLQVEAQAIKDARDADTARASDQRDIADLQRRTSVLESEQPKGTPHR